MYSATTLLTTYTVSLPSLKTQIKVPPWVGPTQKLGSANAGLLRNEEITFLLSQLGLYVLLCWLRRLDYFYEKQQRHYRQQQRQKNRQSIDLLLGSQSVGDLYHGRDQSIGDDDVFVDSRMYSAPITQQELGGATPSMQPRHRHACHAGLSIMFRFLLWFGQGELLSATAAISWCLTFPSWPTLPLLVWALVVVSGE